MDRGQKLKKYLSIGTAALTVGLMAPIWTGAADAAQVCHTSKVAVTKTVRVKEHVKVHGKIVTKTVVKKEKVHVLKSERVKVKGKWVVKKISVVKYKTVTTCTNTVTVTVATAAAVPAAPVVSFQVHLDPTFTQGASPLAVTYDYSADATQTVGTKQTDLAQAGQLPTGILDLYSNGLLACSLSVGGAVTSGKCPVTYTSLGSQTVITEYIPNGIDPVTETDIENIQSFASSVTLGQGTVGAEVVNGNHNYARTVTIPVTVSGQGATPAGTVSMSGGSCTTLTNGSATCSQSIEEGQAISTFSPTITYSGSSSYDSSGSSTSVSIPAASAPVETDITTGLSNVRYIILDANDAQMVGDVSPEPKGSGAFDLGTMHFTDANGQPLCAATNGFAESFTCVFTGTFVGPITATYSGAQFETGDSQLTVWSAA